jgi:hypothetical protein
MKSWGIAAVAILAGLAIAIAGYLHPLVLGASQTAGTPSKTVTVVGTGKIMAVPDIAIVSAGVQTRAETAKDAQSRNNEAMAAVIARIKSLGIADKDVQTSGISLYPVNQPFGPAEGTSKTLPDIRIMAWESSNTVTIVVRDIATTGSVIDSLVDSGANTGLGLRFGLSDPSPSELQALEAATKDAQGRADAIAKGIGVKLTAIQSAVEDSVFSSPINAKFDSMSAAASAPIQPGEVAVSVRVRVTYGY